jgi:hypothetical protein
MWRVKEKIYGLPTFHFCLIMVIYLAYLYVFCILQQYQSMFKRNPFMHDVFTCPYQFKCCCYCALSVKTFSDKVEVALAGEHTASSHSRSSGIVSVKQMSAVKRAVKSSPLSVSRQVHANLENFSPKKIVPFDRRSQKAVARLVRSELREIMAERVFGIDLDNTEGSMNRLADSICLIKLIARNNDSADDFHMDEHQVVQVGHQFKDGVTFMTVTTPHLPNNRVRANSCKFQTQGHFDGAFNWCNRDLALLAFGMNSTGAHYNPVSINCQFGIQDFIRMVLKHYLCRFVCMV